MNNYCVYCHRNIFNNKMYIGMSKDIKTRWSNNGKQYKECIYFYRAIEKYGWDNFEHKILVDNISKEEACVIEKELIEKYKTQDKNFGYNIADGGLGGCTTRGESHFLSKKVYQYTLDGVYVGEWSNAQRASEELGICVSDIHTMCRGEKGLKKAGNFMWSYIKLDSMQPYVRETHSKEPILQLDMDFNIIKKYKNISYINKDEFNGEKVIECCKRKNQYSHNGCYWVYEKDFNQDYINYIIDRKNGLYKKSTSKPINQYDLSNNLLNTFSSAAEAERYTGVNRSSIQAYCKRGEANYGATSKYGFIWKYA